MEGAEEAEVDAEGVQVEGLDFVEVEVAEAAVGAVVAEETHERLRRVAIRESASQ
jgi:hypothetical protein